MTLGFENQHLTRLERHLYRHRLCDIFHRPDWLATPIPQELPCTCLGWKGRPGLAREAYRSSHLLTHPHLCSSVRSGEVGGGGKEWPEQAAGTLAPLKFLWKHKSFSFFGPSLLLLSLCKITPPPSLPPISVRGERRPIVNKGSRFCLAV